MGAQLPSVVQEATATLLADGLVREAGGRLRTTRRWQAAMMRAAHALAERHEPGGDLRLPITLALLSIYRDAPEDDALVALVAAMLPIEAAELGLGQP